MGKSRNPAKAAGKPIPTRTRRDLIDVGVEHERSLVLLNVGGQVTGMTVATTDALIISLTNARNELDGTRDRRPHSRACGIGQHEHGTGCAKDCPTCGGSALVTTP